MSVPLVRNLSIISMVILLSGSVPFATGFGHGMGDISQSAVKPVPDDGIPWGGVLLRSTEGENLSVEQLAIGSIMAQVEEENLHGYITALQGFGSRLYRAPGMYEATEWLASLLVGNGNFIVNYHNITLDRGTLGIFQVSSIILTLPGLDTSSDRVYYMFAHDDSVQYEDYDSLLTNAPGADDDASGCAAVIEAARILGRYRFQDTLRFAFFNAEEIGLIGSDYWAQNMSARSENVPAFIDYDMIGYCRGTTDYELDLYYWPSSAPIAAELLDINTRYGIDLRILPYLSTSRIPSDIQSFYDQGYQGVMGIEEDFNPYYHTRADTVEKLNFSLVKKSTQLAIAALAEWSRLLYVDVSIPHDGFIVSSTEPDEGDDVTINVTVNNTGNLDAGDLRVTLYCDGSPFATRTVDVGANSSVMTNAVWKAAVGLHNISVRLDPESSIVESDETNNEAHEMVAVNDVPVAVMVPSSARAMTGENIRLDASLSHDDVHGIEDYLFEMGDGNSSGWTVSSSYEWSYARDDNYTITLRVRDGKGAISVPFLTVIEVLNRPPIAAASSNMSRALTLVPIRFTSGALDIDGTVSCKWDFGDGSHSEENDPVHTYLKRGTYEVVLEVLDDDLAYTTSSLNINIDGRVPSASIALLSDQGDIRTEFLLRANVSDLDGTIASYQWDLDDGSYSKEASLYHGYERPGTYSVRLTVKDDDGMSAVSTVNVLVKDTPPTAVGSCFPLEALTGEQIEFDGKASSDLEGNVTCIWDFGDGNGSVGDLVHHAYGSPGTFGPVLRVFDQAGSEDLLELPEIHVVNSPPYAIFTVHGQQLVNSTLVFDGSLSRDREGPLGFKWDLGDGTKGEGPVIAHFYIGTGNYTVEMNITDINGASDEVRTVVWIKDVPTDEEGLPDDDVDGEDDDDRNDLENLVWILFISNIVVFLVALSLMMMLVRMRKGSMGPPSDGME
ncbi:MAG: PKD domain-containing protein [Candidatus Thermoplasmatota archaeon]|jgi:PKD repeat protein|nr:PKD domain-containing protein [Candidatus Thermoplasmatota archaeon]